MLDFRHSLINSTLNKVLQRLHYPLNVMLTCVRWYVAYPLSLRHVEEMMQERCFRRPLDRAPLGDEDPAGDGGSLSPTQALRWLKLENG